MNAKLELIYLRHTGKAENEAWFYFHLAPEHLRHITYDLTLKAPAK